MKELYVVPIVVEQRGAMPMDTVNSLKTSGIKKPDRVTVSMLALRSSIEMANEFVDWRGAVR